MTTLHKHMNLEGPSPFVLAMCWTKALLMSAKQRWTLFRLFYLNR